jgi:hypothetical protein
MPFGRKNKTVETHVKIAICGLSTTGKKTFGTIFYQREMLEKKEQNSSKVSISGNLFDIEFLYIQPQPGNTFDDVQPEVSFFFLSFFLSIK